MSLRDLSLSGLKFARRWRRCSIESPRRREPAHRCGGPAAAREPRGPRAGGLPAAGSRRRPLAPAPPPVTRPWCGAAARSRGADRRARAARRCGGSTGCGTCLRSACRLRYAWETDLSDSLERQEGQRSVLRNETGRPGALALTLQAFQIPRTAVRPGPPLAEKGPASVCRRSSTPPTPRPSHPPEPGSLTRLPGRCA